MTKRQRELRQRRVGASDVAAIIGLDPYKSAVDVWYRVTGKLGTGGSSQSKVIELGNLLEEPCLQWWLGRWPDYKTRLRRGGRLVIPDSPIVVHPDARVPGELVVECKTTALLGGGFGRGRSSSSGGEHIDNWGAEYSDEVPARVLIQVQMQMAACDVPRGRVVALIGGRGFVEYYLERDQDLIDRCVDRVRRFWDEHVETDIKPDNPARISDSTVAEMIRHRNKTREIPIETLAEYDAALAAHRETKERLDEATLDLKVSLGDAEIGAITIKGIGGMEEVIPEAMIGVVSFKESTRRNGLDEGKLREAFPGVDFEKFRKPETVYRSLRRLMARNLAPEDVLRIAADQGRRQDISRARAEYEKHVTEVANGKVSTDTTDNVAREARR